MSTLLPSKSFQVPFNDPVQDASGSLTKSWLWFFRSLWDRLYPLGSESSFTLVNNQSTAADITGLKFDSKGVTQASVEYLVQRVTTGSGATELIESGIFIVAYKPTSTTWALNSVSSHAPSNAGVTFSITSSGQVQYTTTSMTGTASISSIFWRARTIGGKNSQYSVMGKR